MKQIGCILAFFTITFQGRLAAQQQRFFDDRAQVEKWMDENNVPALGIGILRDSQLREIRMYGVLKPGVPAPYNAISNIASLTKPVVALLTLNLVSRGQWSLDEPLSVYWIDPDVARDPRHKQLTTRLVLSHQTGFKNWRYMNDSNKLKFETAPGTKFGYSGEGFEYLRKALEKKFKQSLEKLTDSILFRPLGMHDTQYSWDKRTDERRFAHWFDTSGVEHKQDYKKTRVNAADDLLTTLEDYGKFSTHVLRGGGLDSTIFNQMIKPHVPTKDGRFMTLGWEVFLNLGPKKEYALVHSGSDMGVKTLVVLLPVSGQGLIVFMNSDRGQKLYDKLVVELLDMGAEMMKQVK